MSRRKAKPPVPRKRRKTAGGGSDGDVGYGRPPRRHQFQPGQSGNPNGRPKGSKNTATILTELMDRKVPITRNGRVERITVKEAMLLRIADDGLKGNIKSAAHLLDRYEAIVSGDIPPDDLGEDDKEVLEACLRRLMSRKQDES